MPAVSATRPQGIVLIAAGGWHDESPGGANRLPTDFARFLAGRGRRVVYLCPSPAVTATARERVDDVEIWRYPAPAAPSPSFRNVLRHWTRSRAIVRTVRAQAPIAALLGHTQLQYLAIARYCSRQVRRCYAVHSPFAAELREAAVAAPSLRQRVSWRAARVVEQRILALSDVVHCDSTYTLRYMRAAYARAVGSRAIALPGWVDTKRFRAPAIGRDELRARLRGPWAPGVATFFTLRRLYPRTGLDLLVEAAAELHTEGRGFRVIVGGDGPERGRLEALAAARGVGDRVAFVGRVPDDRLADTFAAADCCVLPSRALECFGLIVLEAYACGVPVIGTPVGAIPEVMGPEQAAWIAAEASASAIADRMRAFLDGALAPDLPGLRARALEFDIEAVAPRHEQVLLDGVVGVARPAAAAASGGARVEAR